MASAGLLTLGILTGVEGIAALQGELHRVVHYGPWLVATYLAAGMTIILAWRAHERPEGRSLVLLLTFCVLFWTSQIYGMFPGIRPALGGRVDGFLSTATLPLGPVAATFALVAFLRFSSLYPRPLTVRDLAKRREEKRQRNQGTGRLRLLAWLEFMVSEGGAAPRPLRRHLARPLLTASRMDAMLLDARLVWSLPLLLLVALPGLAAAGVYLLPTGLEDRAFVALVVSLVAWMVGASLLAHRGMAHLWAGFRGASDEDRRRIQWVVAGFVGAAAAFLLAGAVVWGGGLGIPDSITDPVSSGLIGLVPLIFLGCVAIGIFYSGALDPELVIRRTTLSGLVLMGLTLLFVGLEQLVSTQMVDRFDLPGRTGSMIAGVTVAMLFNTIRVRAERLTNRLVAPLSEAAGEEVPPPGEGERRQEGAHGA